MTSSDLSYAVELSDGLEITDTDLSFSKNSQILDNNELLDPKQDNSLMTAINYPHHVVQKVMIWIKKNHCKVF